LALLQAIADMPEDSVRQGLSHLQAAEFLYEASLFPDLEYTFKHALTHDVAYGSLLQDRRRALHARIVDAIETLHSERLTEHIERLAHHAVHGEVWEKALTYLRQAGAKAFARSANEEAAAHFEQALTALGHHPKTREHLEEGVDVRLALRNALWPLGRFESCFEHLGDAERLATTLDDPRRLGWITAYMAEHMRMTGHAPDAPAFAERALRISERVEDLPLSVAANYYLGTAYFVAGDYRQVDEFFQRILQLLAGDRFRERCGLAGFPTAMSRFFWALALSERGEFEQGMSVAHEGIEVAEILDHPYSLIYALRGLSRVHRVKGDLDLATRLAAQGVEVARDRHQPQALAEASVDLGHLYALTGRVDEGVAVLEDALRAMEAMGNIQWRTPLLVHLGEAYLGARRSKDAASLAERGLALASERGHRGIVAWARRLLGEIASHHDRSDVATAEAHYDAAIAQASELGMRPLIAHCHLGLAKLYPRTRKREQAQENLTTATTMYREMGMTYWLDQAEVQVNNVTR
jgi:tetratricopeptide (TPR) repeat protein